MIESLVITLREGIEAALVVGIILAYLQRSGRMSLKRYVYWGLGLAVLASIVSAAVLQMIGFDPENEFMEGALLGIGGIFVATMVLWMWRTARNLRQHMEHRLDSIVASEERVGGLGIGLLAFTFLMVAREGIETVLFLAAATMGQASVLNLVGGFLGISLAVLFAVFFIRGSLRINLKIFFTATTVVLLILAARLLAGSVHEFAEVGVIPMSAGVMKLIGYFVQDKASILLLMGLVAVPVLLVLWDHRRPAEAAAVAGASPAERRKVLARQRGERMWRFSLLGAAIIIFPAMASSVLASSPFVDPLPQAVSSSGGEIRLATEGWRQGDLQKFSYSASGSGTPVRFLATRLEDGTLLVAVDACQICGGVGYMQEREGKNAICKNCNAPIPLETLGFGGGCNPLPLSGRLEGSTLVITTGDLDKLAGIFQGV